MSGGELVGTRDYEHLLSRLNLKAVLPVVAPMVELDDVARALVAPWNFALRLSTFSGVATTLDFHHGRVEVDWGRADSSPLRLVFMSDRQLNRAFSHDGTVIPLIAGGFKHLRKLQDFQRLMGRLEHLLKSPPSELGARLTEIQVMLMVGYLLPAAVVQLVSHEPQSHELMRRFGDVVATLRVADKTTSWFSARHGHFSWGYDEPGVAPDVEMIFTDVDAAAAALGGELDQLAAVGAGEVVIRGLIPLAHALGTVMERASAYLR